MKKFHIRDNGELGICSAKETCPLGDGTPHAEFQSKEEAQAWVEKMNESKAGGTFSKNEKLARRWAYKELVANVAARGDQESLELLEIKIANAKTEGEVANVISEFEALTWSDGNSELAAKLLAKVDNPDIMEGLGKKLLMRTVAKDSEPFLKTALTHPLTTADLRLAALSSSALSYQEKAALLGENATLDDRVALLRSTNWQDEGKRSQTQELDAAVELLKDKSDSSVDLYTAAALIGASKATGNKLDPNLLLRKVSLGGVHIVDADRVISYGMESMGELNKDSLLKVADVVYEHGYQDDMIILKNAAEERFGAVRTRAVFHETEVESLKRRYEMALVDAGGRIQRNLSSDANSRAIKARDKYNMTRYESLKAEYRAARKASEKLLISNQAKNEAADRARELDGLIRGARKELLYDAVVRKFNDLNSR